MILSPDLQGCPFERRERLRLVRALSSSRRERGLHLHVTGQYYIAHICLSRPFTKDHIWKAFILETSRWHFSQSDFHELTNMVLACQSLGKVTPHWMPIHGTFSLMWTRGDYMCINCAISLPLPIENLIHIKKQSETLCGNLSFSFAPYSKLYKLCQHFAWDDKHDCRLSKSSMSTGMHWRVHSNGC